MIIDINYDEKKLRMINFRLSKILSFAILIRLSKYNEPGVPKNHDDHYDLVLFQHSDGPIVIHTKHYKDLPISAFNDPEWLEDMIYEVCPGKEPDLQPKIFKLVFVSKNLYAEPVCLSLYKKILLTIKHPLNKELDIYIELDYNLPKILGKEFVLFSANFCNQKIEKKLNLNKIYSKKKNI